jgi:transposase
MLTLGIDIHTRSHRIDVLDAEGKAFRAFRVRGGHDQLVEAVAALRQPVRVCFEASIECGVIHDRLSALPNVREIIVAHPAHLRRSHRKNDRIDAKRLAVDAFHGRVDPVHIPSPKVRQWRQLVEFRCRQVQKRTRVKNAIKSLLRSRGIVPPIGLWTKEGRRWLRRAAMPDPTARLRRGMLLQELRLLDAQLRTMRRTLDSIAVKDGRVDLLRTAPGIGRRTAEAVVAWIDDPLRFVRSSTVGSYFGIVPSQDQSGERNHLGGITKAGPKVVRWLLVEAAWRAVRKEGPIRDRYLRLLRGDPQRRRRAVVAIARHLALTMQAMLRDNQPWSACRAAGRAEEVPAATS